MDCNECGHKMTVIENYIYECPQCKIIQREQNPDYLKLKKKYEIAEKRLHDHPERYGGREYIEGYLSGLIEGMTLLDNNLISRAC